MLLEVMQCFKNDWQPSSAPSDSARMPRLHHSLTIKPWFQDCVDSCLFLPHKIFINFKIKIYYSIWIALDFEVCFMQYKTQLFKISTLKLKKLDWKNLVLFPHIFQKQLLVLLILFLSWSPTHHRVQIALNYSVSIKNWNVIKYWPEKKLLRYI